MPTHDRIAKQRARTLRKAQARALVVIERLVWAVFELDATVTGVSLGLRTTRDENLTVHAEATYSKRQPTDLNPAVEALKRALRTTHLSQAMLLLEFDGPKSAGDRIFRRTDYRRTEL